MGLKELIGDHVHDKSKGPANLTGKKVVGIYFSAHWCPPCRQFTPVLVDWYNMLKEEDTEGDDLEIVFVSSDRDQASFDDYFSTMPWCCLAFSDSEKKKSLSEKYGVRGIPTLVLVDGEGELITKDGRNIVQGGKKIAQIKKMKGK